ncbi:hypothetical protein T484DRAFT_3448851 [Baffinella frigidus]|nr:hypothetical protein T484DRAFT_3448851 [Cryptophyta sp. CCMP2293]
MAAVLVQSSISLSNTHTLALSLTHTLTHTLPGGAGRRGRRDADAQGLLLGQEVNPFFSSSVSSWARELPARNVTRRRPLRGQHVIPLLFSSSFFFFFVGVVSSWARSLPPSRGKESARALVGWEAAMAVFPFFCLSCWARGGRHPCSA